MKTDKPMSKVTQNLKSTLRRWIRYPWKVDSQLITVLFTVLSGVQHAVDVPEDLICQSNRLQGQRPAKLGMKVCQKVFIQV